MQFRVDHEFEAPEKEWALELQLREAGERWRGGRVKRGRRGRDRGGGLGGG